MKPSILVTGASGFIAQHVVVQLLETGAALRGTVRSQAKAERLKKSLSAHTTKLDNLQLVVADLTRDDGWDQAAEGCEFVQHLASPLPKVLPKNHEDLIGPARDGALRVLRAAKSAGTKRVVMTSSAAAVVYGWESDLPKVFDESHWSRPDVPKDNTAYTRSKTIAEKAAWDYIEKDGEGLQLVTINPCAVLGPMLGDFVPTSLELVSQPLAGKLPAIPRIGVALVDVRDVADAHVRAMTVPEAAGERFLVGDEFLTFRELVQVLREEFPDYHKKLPTRNMPSWILKVASIFNPVLKQVVPELGKERRVTHAKAERILNWSARPAREAIIEAARSVIAVGLE